MSDVTEKVTKIKTLYAEVIDLLNEERNSVTDGTQNNKEIARHLSIAITDAETAQMRAVKAVTWGK